MGDRANYAIRENGQVELYYSHWGAVTVAEDVFWGPAKTEAFIRSNERTTEWLDDVWAQGGVALDKDNRHLTYYYCEWPDEEDLRHVYESLLEETWRASAWSVSRAQAWQALAAAVGVDPDVVTATPTGPGLIAFDQLGKNLDRSSCCAVLSVKTDEGWQDRAIDFLLPGFLMNGPALIERLSAVADLGQLRAAFQRRRDDDVAKTLGDWIDEFCAVDVSRCTLRVSLPEHEEQWFPFLQDAWPGWTLQLESGGASEHFAYMGRDVLEDLLPSPKPPAPSPPSRSYEECVHLIRDHLDGNEARKAADFSSHIKLIQKLNEKDGPVTVAPGFLNRVPTSQSGLLDRLKLAIRLRARRLKT